MTSLPLIIAEELDADWTKVRDRARPRRTRTIYGNPGFGGMMYTAGSNAVTSYYRPLRTMGAQVRRVLLDNAARKLGRAGRGADHRAERRGAREVRAAGSATATSRPSPRCRPRRRRSSLTSSRSPADFRLIGKDVMRVELPSKVNGRAQYGIDIQVPGMLYGTVMRPPVEGSVPDKSDDSKAKAVPGVIAVVRASARRRCGGRTAMGCVQARQALLGRSRGAGPYGLGLRQRQGARRLRGRCHAIRGQPARDWSAQGDARGEIQKAASTRRRRVSLRLRLSCANGAAERGCIGIARGRCGRDLGRHAEPDHGHGSAGQALGIPRAR